VKDLYPHNRRRSSYVEKNSSGSDSRVRAVRSCSSKMFRCVRGRFDLTALWEITGRGANAVVEAMQLIAATKSAIVPTVDLMMSICIKCFKLGDGKIMNSQRQCVVVVSRVQMRGGRTPRKNHRATRANSAVALSVVLVGCVADGFGLASVKFGQNQEFALLSEGIRNPNCDG
jgi:hypothetical protein